MSHQVHTRSWRCTPTAWRSAKDEFARFGGSTSGSESEGTLAASTPMGRLEGRYQFDGEELTIVVITKPPLLPIEMIWNRLDQICGPPVARS